MLLTKIVGPSLIAVACVLLVPPYARAQQSLSGIAGLVKDTSGAVLPGVTVEAASPALIERVRTVVTDGQGAYKIVDLRPGTYVVSFTLPGFATVKREGIELTAGFTTTANADMKVGGVEETITVSGASPLVDVQNTRQQKVFSSDLLNTLPTASKGFMTLVAVTPGFAGIADVGGSVGTYSGMAMQSATYHGRIGTKVQFDGMTINNMELNGNAGYMMNSAVVSETTVETGGASAQSPGAGAVVNLIPRDGGNAFSFGAAGLFTNDGLQSDNLTDELRSRGLTTVNKVLKIYDGEATLGGPIKKDTLWFFTAHRGWGNNNQSAGLFYNKTQGTPFYTPDPTRPADLEETYRAHTARLTWQASRSNKVTFFIDIQDNCLCRHIRAGNNAPEAIPGYHFWPNGLAQVTWSSPVNGKLLLEGGFSAVISHWPNYPQTEVTPNDISILDTSTGLRYNSYANIASISYGGPKDSDRYTGRFNASYVTGSHAFKAGLQMDRGVHNLASEVNGDIAYQFNGTVPTTIVEYATPYLQKEELKADLGIFAQDQWTLKRVTLNLGLRFDYFNAYVPSQSVPATRFLPARNFAPVDDVPNWKDLNPRVGVSYDLFGNSRTALKAALSRYMGQSAVAIAAANNPMVTSVNSVTRTWNDANRNYIPDCDLTNPASNGECLGISNVNFGLVNPLATRYADDAIHGFGNRDYGWDFAAEVQHQIASPLSLTAGYYRSWNGNFLVTDNLDVTPSDYAQYCITAPLDARLPGSGGYPVCGLYDVAPVKFGQNHSLVTQASNYGQQTRSSDFISVNVNLRSGRGVRLGGGIDTGRIVTDSCFVVDSPQQLLNCHVGPPWSASTQLKLYGSYPLPFDIVISGAYQNVAGPQVTASYQASNDEIAPTLGRNLAACSNRVPCTATVTGIPLIPPMTMFEARRSQLDLRFTKLVRAGGKMRVQANVDVYNVLNASSILGINTTYGQQWLRPLAGLSTGQAILDARLIEFSGRLTF